METVRLRRLQTPSEVERLLELFIASRDLLPQDLYPIKSLEGVPRELRRVVTQATDRGWVWACWAHDVRTWLFTAEMSLPLSRERGTPVLHIKRYRDDLLEDSGTWTTDPRGGWYRCDE